QALREPGGLLPEASPCHAGEHDRGVVGPHAAAVIAQRSVATLGGRHRAQTEARVDPRARERRDDLALLTCVEQPGAEQVPDVARERVNGLLARVEGDRREVPFRASDPERLAEPTGESLGP